LPTPAPAEPGSSSPTPARFRIWERPEREGGKGGRGAASQRREGHHHRLPCSGREGESAGVEGEPKGEMRGRGSPNSAIYIHLLGDVVIGFGWASAT